MADATPISDSGIDLSGEITERVNSALEEGYENGKPLTVSYVDAEGKPHLSLRGSTLAISRDQLAIWVREAEGGIATAIVQNPNVSLLYRDNATRTTYIFSGRAHIDNDPEVRDAIFEAMPKPEQDHDRDGTRKGVAMIIDVDSVVGNTVGGVRIKMSRA